MTRFQTRLLAAALGSALIAFAGPGGKKGGGGGDTQPSTLPVISDFLAGNAMETDGAPYADANLSGGWSNMPGSGNFTLALQGSGGESRGLWMDFSNPVVQGTPLDPSIAAYDDPENRDARVLVPIFLSMNLLCSGEMDDSNGEYLYYDPQTEACNDGGSSSGSLKAMTGSGPDILVNFRGDFPDPFRTKAQIRVHCGPVPSNRVNEVVIARTPDPIRATCEAGRSDDACLRWRLRPDTAGGSLTCSVFRRETVKGQPEYTPLGLYEMPLDLVLQRDENGDGLPD